MRILLAEDDPMIARDVTTHLARAGYVVRHETNGEEAWFAAPANKSRVPFMMLPTSSAAYAPSPTITARL